MPHDPRLQHAAHAARPLIPLLGVIEKTHGMAVAQGIGGGGEKAPFGARAAAALVAGFDMSVVGGGGGAVAAAHVEEEMFSELVARKRACGRGRC